MFVLKKLGDMMFNRLLRTPKVAAKRTLDWLTSPQAAIVFGEALFRLAGISRETKGRSLSQVKRVLIVRLDEIGDVVLISPFLRELRRNLPYAWITLIVKPAVYNLVELCPYVNEVLTYDWDTQGRFWQVKRHWRALELAKKHMWKRRFDLAIIPRFDVDYYHATFLTYFSGASSRIGYSENINEHKKIFNAGYDRLLTHAMTDNALKHEVEHNLYIISYLGGIIKEKRLEIWTNSEDEKLSESILKTHRVNSKTEVVAFGVGGRAQKRIWPISNFTELAMWLRKERFCAHILVIGGPGEEALGHELVSHLGNMAINIVGRTTLRQTAALLNRCCLYVGNDSGPMHLAAAAGVPVVEISSFPKNASPYDPNSPSRFHPWGVPYAVLQPQQALYPCVDVCTAKEAHCITAISVSDVQNAIIKMLQKVRSSSDGVHN